MHVHLLVFFPLCPVRLRTHLQGHQVSPACIRITCVSCTPFPPPKCVSGNNTTEGETHARCGRCDARRVHLRRVRTTRGLLVADNVTIEARNDPIRLPHGNEHPIEHRCETQNACLTELGAPKRETSEVVSAAGPESSSSSSYGPRTASACGRLQPLLYADPGERGPMRRGHATTPAKVVRAIGGRTARKPQTRPKTRADRKIQKTFKAGDPGNPPQDLECCVAVCPPLLHPQLAAPCTSLQYMHWAPADMCTTSISVG